MAIRREYQQFLSQVYRRPIYLSQTGDPRLPYVVLVHRFASNQSESEQEYPLKDEQGQYRLKTRPEVLHAEMNALMKLAKSTESGENASLFITHAPCLECAKGIYQSGIKEIYYRDQYRSTSGLEFLQNCGINITKVSDV